MTGVQTCALPIYLKHLSKIEFVVTNACTGRCKHCSEGDHTACGESINPTVAADAVRSVGGLYALQTVMTFGGEPLLYPDAVCTIMTAAKELNIPRRQVITNGFFTKDEGRMEAVADGLAACGVNDLLLSVDAFHQETIPAPAVMAFARAVLARGIPLRLQPAWLVSSTDDNPYNARTREVLAAFEALTDKEGNPVPVGEGNVIFPEGNALRYLGEYFRDGAPPNPYEEDPRDIRCLSVDPDGTALNGNVYEVDVMDVLEGYTPPVPSEGGAS